MALKDARSPKGSRQQSISAADLLPIPFNS